MSIRENFVFKVVFFGALLIVGIIYSVIPHFVRYETLKEEGLRYVPVTLGGEFDHINFGGGRYRDVVDGRLIPGEIDTYEHMDGPILFPMLAPTVMAPFFLPFDSIFPGFVLTDFLFPILVFSALFLVLYSFTSHRYFSLFSAYVLVLFPQISVLIPPSSFLELKILLTQFIPFSGFQTSSLDFLARESYIPAGPFFVMFFYSVYRVIADVEKKKIFIILSGIFYGLLFYLYFFFWVFATIFLGVLFIILLFKKEYENARMVFFAGMAGAIISIPFWINQLELMGLLQYKELIARQGIEEGRAVKWFLWKTYALHIGMAVLALYLGKKCSKKILGYFLASIALASVVAYNINVVTGWMIQVDHWGNKVFLITNGILLPPLIYYTWRWLTSYARGKGIYFSKKIPFLFSVIVLLFLTTHVVESSIAKNKARAGDFTVPAGLMDAYAWLTRNTPKESVVMSPSVETNIELAAYTHNRIFHARAQNNLLSKEEILQRIYITHALFGVPIEKFYESTQDEDWVFSFFSYLYNSKAPDTTLRQERYNAFELPEAVVGNMLYAYALFSPPEEIPYRLDYLFVGPRERSMDIREEAFGKYEKLYENKEVAIYKYKSDM